MRIVAFKSVLENLSKTNLRYINNYIETFICLFILLYNAIEYIESIKSTKLFQNFEYVNVHNIEYFLIVKRKLQLLNFKIIIILNFCV